jgi:hypothetical protein
MNFKEEPLQKIVFFEQRFTTSAVEIDLRTPSGWPSSAAGTDLPPWEREPEGEGATIPETFPFTTHLSNNVPHELGNK